jgi:RAB protein geranylgeranyltransferase component A
VSAIQQPKKNRKKVSIMPEEKKEGNAVINLTQLSSEIVTSSGTAIGVLQEVKEGHANAEKIDEVIEKLENLKLIAEKVTAIEKHVRPLSFWQKVKAEILRDIIKYVVVFIIGIILTLLGLVLSGHSI